MLVALVVLHKWHGKCLTNLFVCDYRRTNAIVLLCWNICFVSSLLIWCAFFFLKTFYLHKNSTVFSRIAPLGNRLFQNLHGWGLSCRTLLHMILHSVGGSPARLPGGGGVLRSKICGVSTWQASVCVTFAHVSLTKTISMAKPRSKRARWPVVSTYSHAKRKWIPPLPCGFVAYTCIKSIFKIPNIFYTALFWGYNNLIYSSCMIRSCY